MKKSKTNLAFLLAISFLSLPLNGYGQPIIPKEKIPSNISANVRKGIEGLYSADPVMRIESIWTLADMGTQVFPAIPFLVAILDDRPHPAKGAPNVFYTTTPGAQAELVLVSIGKPAVEPLITALKDYKDHGIRRRTAYLLGMIGNSLSVEPLINALNDEHGEVRAGAARALGEIKDSRSIDSLIVALNDEHWAVRTEAARALGEIKNSRSIDSLIVALNDNKSIVRKSAARALGVINDSRAIEPLIDVALRDDADENNLVAMDSLRRIMGDRVIEPFIFALKDDRPFVRNTAAWLLGEIKDTHAIEPLIIALKDQNRDVQRNAASALRKIVGKDFGTNSEKWQKWWAQSKEDFLKGR